MKEQNRTSAGQKSIPNTFVTAELPDEKIKAIAATKMDSRHDNLNRLLDEK
jgi:hypothetical protein